MEAPILQIRSEAKETLKGNWGTAIGMMFAEYGIYYGFSIVFTIFSYFVMFIALIASIPLMSRKTFDVSDFPLALIFLWLAAIFFIVVIIVAGTSVCYSVTIGKNAWYFATAKGEKPKFGILFSWFFKAKKTVKTIKLYLWRILFSLLWGFIFIIPGGAIGAAIFIFKDELNAKFSLTSDITGIFTLVMLGCMLLFFICYLIYLVIIQRYALANYLLVEDETRTAKQAIDLSVKLMRGRAFDIVLLFLSVLGIVIVPYIVMIAGYIVAMMLSAFIIGILIYFLCLLAILGLMIYFYPWFEMAIAKYTLWVIAHNENKYVEIEINA